MSRPSPTTMPVSLDPILRPRSVAVIGASRSPNTIGWQIVDNLLRHQFHGPIYPVNPKAGAVHSIAAYPSIADVPGPVDLAVIAVPKEHVLAVAEQCIAAGVRGLVVISAGFKEVGGDGVARERTLVELVRAAGVRLIGPNCLGVINTDPAVRLNATFAPSMPPPGSVGFISQSGAIGLTVLDYAESLGIGISAFVSSGNKADVSGNDLLIYWKDDPTTQVILMYLENFGNPTRFVEIARTITREKPICVVKSGRTGAGARAAASHTGALAGTELATDALVAQAGALRAQTVQELFDLAMAFANQPLPGGNRVAIVSNAGGPGIILADACEARGLAVPPLGSGTEATLRAKLPQEASVTNPVDLIASARAETYELALSSVLDDQNVDAVIASFVPPLGIQTEDVAEAIVRVNARHREKPLLAVLMGREGLPAGMAKLHEARIPGYLFPESAARALGAMWQQRQIASRPQGRQATFEVDDVRVTELLDTAMAAGRSRLAEPDALRVLEAYGITTAAWHFVPTAPTGSLPHAVAEAASQLGFPVAMKLISPAVVHKTDVGAVELNLPNAAAAKRAARAMVKRVGEKYAETVGRDETETEHMVPVDGVLIQQMAPSGIETIVGLNRLERVGPMVMFGLGGIYVEVLRDVVLRLAPLLDVDAEEMIRQVKLFKLLQGVRGVPPRDLAALAETILRVSQLAERHPRIVEMDINPLVALEQGAVAVDARIQLAPEESAVSTPS